MRRALLSRLFRWPGRGQTSIRASARRLRFFAGTFSSGNCKCAQTICLTIGVHSTLISQLGNTWEQNRLQILVRLSVPVWSDVAVDIEGRFYSGVSQLLLSDLGRNPQIVQKRRANVAELMPSHPQTSQNAVSGPRPICALSQFIVHFKPVGLRVGVRPVFEG